MRNPETGDRNSVFTAETVEIAEDAREWGGAAGILVRRAVAKNGHRALLRGKER